MLAAAGSVVTPAGDVGEGWRQMHVQPPLEGMWVRIRVKELELGLGGVVGEGWRQG